jgi:hypothetical protein
MAVKIKRETPPSNIYDYSPPDSLQYGQIAQDAVGNIYSADRSNNIVKQMSSTANAQVGNPNLLYNGSLSVNQRGQTSYLQSWGYSIDGWVLIGDFNYSTKTLTFDASNNIARFGLDAISYMRHAIVDVDSSDFGRYTLSAKVDGTVYSKSFYLGNTSYSDAYDMGSFYFTYEKYSGVSTWWFGIGVVPGETGPGSVSIEWVKLEKGTQATNYTPKKYLDELNECRKYYIKYPSWQMLGSGYINWEGKQAHVLIPVGQQMRTNPTASTISCELYCGNGSIISWGPGAPPAITRPGWVSLQFDGSFTQLNQTCCLVTKGTQLELSAEI